LELTVTALLMPLILLLTVVASVALGILATYAMVLGILHSFGRPAQKLEPVRPRLVLVPTQNHASGD